MYIHGKCIKLLGIFRTFWPKWGNCIKMRKIEAKLLFRKKVAKKFAKNVKYGV